MVERLPILKRAPRWCDFTACCDADDRSTLVGQAAANARRWGAHSFLLSAQQYSTCRLFSERISRKYTFTRVQMRREICAFAHYLLSPVPLKKNRRSVTLNRRPVGTVGR